VAASANSRLRSKGDRLDDGRSATEATEADALGGGLTLARAESVARARRRRLRSLAVVRKGRFMAIVSMVINN
jgi:hypothetical protein